MSLPPYTIGLGHEVQALGPNAPAFSLKHDVTVVQDGVALLPGAWRVQPNIKALLKAALLAIQERADENWAVYTGQSFWLATGTALEQWAHRVGTTRGGLSDEELRNWIMAKVLADNSKGTADSALDVLLAATQPRKAEYINLGSGCCQLQIFREEPLGAILRGRVHRLMESIQPNGREMHVVECVVGARGPYRADGLTTAAGPLGRVV